MIFLSSFAFAQVVRDETFVPVSSALIGYPENGCVIACVTGMLVSLNDSRIGVDPRNISSKLNQTIGPNWGYPQRAPPGNNLVLNALMKFMINLP